jgi:hypothetical protein
MTIAQSTSRLRSAKTVLGGTGSRKERLAWYNASQPHRLEDSATIHRQVSKGLHTVRWQTAQTVN